MKKRNNRNNMGHNRWNYKADTAGATSISVFTVEASNSTGDVS